MLTVEMKDKVLKTLVEFGTRPGLNINESQKDFGFQRDYLSMILDQFERMGLIVQKKILGGTIHIHMNAEIYDFHSHGGFSAQEDLLSKNIEKLLLEIESLKPSMPDRINTITTIAANISTALGLFVK